MYSPTCSKAALIRQYLANFPQLGPTEMARKIQAENPGMTVRPQEVSTLRGRLAHKHITKEPSQPVIDVAESVECLKKAISALGKEQVRKLLDLL